MSVTLSEQDVRRELDGFFNDHSLAQKLIDSAQGQLDVARLYAESILKYMTQASSSQSLYYSQRIAVIAVCPCIIGLQCRPSKIIPLLSLIEQLVSLQGALFLEAFRPILLQVDISP